MCKFSIAIAQPQNCWLFLIGRDFPHQFTSECNPLTCMNCCHVQAVIYHSVLCHHVLRNQILLQCEYPLWIFMLLLRDGNSHNTFHTMWTVSCQWICQWIVSEMSRCQLYDALFSSYANCHNIWPEIWIVTCELSYFFMAFMNSRCVFSSSRVAHFCSACCSLCWVLASSSRSHEFSWHSLRTCARSFCLSDSIYSKWLAKAIIT